MDYDRIINATYNWFSFSKAIWFVFFFWLSLPVLFLVPFAFESGFFYYNFSWAIQTLYVITYFLVILGLLLLTCFTLNKKNCNSKNISFTRFIDTVFLVFCELFYVFIWNKNKKYRFTQILLILGTILLYYYNSIIISQFILVSLFIFIICYVGLILYNAIRVSFSLVIFYHKDCSIKEAINLSWYLTYSKFWQVFFSYFFNIASVVVIFIIISIVLGALSNLLLINYLTLSLSYRLAMTFATLFALAPALVGYYFGFMETYLQLNQQYESNNRIKRVLASKINKPSVVIKKKNVANKNILKKKTKKKKLVKKKLRVKKSNRKK
ncbi:MAG: hypothetical protein PHP82_01135 [Candidatus ainarchaeum sp.]|nr:hypothetical protein [Candidatus ainarchaeum sp.]